MSLAWMAFAYVATLACYAMTNISEFRRCPEKGLRYAALPIAYKLGCWCGAIPLLVAGVFVTPFLSLVGFVGWAVLQGLCIRWYEANGHLTPYDTNPTKHPEA